MYSSALKDPMISCTGFASAEKKMEKIEKKNHALFHDHLYFAAIGCLGLLYTTCVDMYAVPLVCCEFC